MVMESDGLSQDNPRLYESLKDAPRRDEGHSPTIHSYPAFLDWFKIAGKPAAGPWPPHQQPRPDPDDESLPVAIVEPVRPDDRTAER